MSFFDSHAHLESIDDDLDAVLRRASEAGVDRVITIGDDIPTSEWATDTASKRNSVWSTAGMHPHNAKLVTQEALERIEELASHPRCVGVGETGLDYFYDKSPREMQRDAFQKQIEIAARTEKTLVIHTRDAWEDTFSILSGYSGRIVFHCFTGGPAEAERALSLGAYLSFSGIVTFRNAQPIRDAAVITPLDRLLLETDAPFLAPIPMRGKRNEPAFLVHTAEEIGRVTQHTRERLRQQTALNTVRAFAIS
ncbi:MAG: TatD family hydrolase [Actinomycetota bacterium]